MIAWAFILSVAYWAGWTGASIQTGWAWLSLTLPWMIWRGAAIPWPLQVLGAGASGFALISLLWAPASYFAIYSLWLQACIALSFILGLRLASLDGVMKGFALGFSVSSAVSVLQHFGTGPVLQYISDNPAGLFFNPSLAAIGFGLMIFWLALRRAWLYIPALLPGLLLNHSRSFWIASAITGLIWAARRTRTLPFLLPALFIGAVWYLYNPLPRDVIRIELWQAIAGELRPFGWGPGIINYIALNLQGSLVRPEYAHNEFLDFAAQYGVGAVFIFALALAPLAATKRPEWYIYVTFLITCLYGFPLHSAPLAAMGAILAGHLSRDWVLVRLDCRSWRPSFLPRHATA